MSTITVEQGVGALRARVVRSRRISPGFQRVTIGGEDLARLRWRGFDQWVRLFLPPAPGVPLDHVPDRLTRLNYARMLAVPAAQRPVVRSYTLSDGRPEAREVDIDFVLHGTHGVAGPWAASCAEGDPLAILDQGCGWPSPAAGHVVLAADETGLPAVAGILRDLPAATAGIAVVEVADEADRRTVPAPSGIDVAWVVRRADEAPGEATLRTLAAAALPEADRHAFAVGESRLATGVRRLLVRDRGWAKTDVTFCGYWRR